MVNKREEKLIFVDESWKNIKQEKRAMRKKGLLNVARAEQQQPNNSEFKT